MNMPGFTAGASIYKTSGHYLTGAPNELGGSRGVLPQVQDDTVWTTDKICEACGCTVSGFQCNCGLRPDPKKVECIKNGGPSKVVSVLGVGGIGGDIFTRGGLFSAD
jgi:hypothetical protein